ncbi:MAG: heme ABC exporter ATP-binding protein CcmA [Hyphomicrobium sp.]
MRSIATLFLSAVLVSVQLVAENLVIERGGRVIVSGASFTVQSGEALLLTGPNGAGKTTLLRALAGFLPLEAGTVRVDPPLEDKPLAEFVHAIGHANAVKAHLTVGENTLFWARFLAGEDGAGMRASAALDAFALSDLEDVPASYLSAGQKRRLGLARLLSAPRPIWLLDEPTVSLDTASTARLAKVVNAHTSSGGIVVAATHLPLGLERTREFRLERGSVAA